MAALVQSYPQPSSITMLQARPSSASGILQPTSHGHAHHHFSTGASHRNSFHGMGAMQFSNYRGPASMTTMNPYPLAGHAGMGSAGQRSNNPHLQSNQRTTSAPIVPTAHHHDAGHMRGSRYPAQLSVSTSSSSSSSDLSSLSHRSGSKDDSVIAGTARVATRAPRPHSTFITATSTPTLAPPALMSSGKATPDRYRRPGNRRNDSSSSTPQNSQVAAASMPNVLNFYGTGVQAAKPQALSLEIPQFSGEMKASDDLQAHQAGTTKDQAAKRYRRRSIHTIEASEGPAPASQAVSRQLSSADGRIDQQQYQTTHQQHPLRSSPIVSIRPATAHGRNESTDSLPSTHSSQHSRPSSAKREAPSKPGSPSSSPSLPTSIITVTAEADNGSPRLVHIPPRGSSDAAKRTINPSPLSKPMTMSPEAPLSKDALAPTLNVAPQSSPKPTYAQVATGTKPSSPAAQQLAALNEKEGKKSKTSRLRRAFSFGSAAELRRASAENSAANNAAAAANSAGSTERTRLRKDRDQDEQDAEQARIVEQQEAAGIGASIYSGQGNFFAGSTDNLSISSTASSASVMIRKMGKGMKKSTRSLVGLFRPKSVVGVPPADGLLPEVSQAQVSMVTVEAEREKVNVNAHAHDLVAGGTGYPRLERNSIETGAAIPAMADRLSSASTDNSAATRRSIVGGEKERADVLAAVKKGILKRTGTDSSNTSSPVVKPEDLKTPNFGLPQIPHVNDSPNSSAPSTPSDDPHVHRRTGSVTLGGEDYFMSALRFRGESKSLPATPQGGVGKRNATFSPRIQFHDTWPSGEYDRRGEIATCNRLTPMLAQQIKEELNTFKMEMEVHENSKIYTHFF